MPFTPFTGYGAASRLEATLRTSGYLFVSRGTFKRAGDERARHYQLLYDEATHKVGIRLVADPDVTDESIREVTKERSGGAVNLAPLLRFYGFPKLKEKLVLPVAFEDGMIVVDLTPLRPKESAES